MIKKIELELEFTYVDVVAVVNSLKDFYFLHL